MTPDFQVDHKADFADFCTQVHFSAAFSCLFCRKLQLVSNMGWYEAHVYFFRGGTALCFPALHSDRNEHDIKTF